MKKIFNWVIVILVLSAPIAKAQDAHFSQFYASYLYLNPALASVEPSLTFSSNYRTQWRSVVQPYVTNQVSMTTPVTVGKVLPRKIGGFGLSVYNDRAGDGNLTTLGVSATFAYNQSFNDGLQVLSIGGQAGFIQKNIDFTNLRTGEQYSDLTGFDPTVAPTDFAAFNNTVMVPDFNAGFVFYHNPEYDPLLSNTSVHVGASVYHINQPNESFVDNVEARLPMIYKIHGGVGYKINERLNLSPNALFMMQEDLLHLNFGMYAAYRLISNPMGMFANTDVLLGVWHRLNDSFIVSTGFSNDVFTLGFSYDLNSNELNEFTGGNGAFEISLTLRKGKEREFRRFDTPRI